VDLNAVPLAQIQANTAANQSANLHLGSASKSPQLGHSPKSRGSRSKSAPKPDKLNVTKSRSKDGVEWTIKTGRRGEGKPDFRVRPTDSTRHRVMFRFYDEAGRRRERYSCYLSKAEWRAVQWGKSRQVRRPCGGESRSQIFGWRPGRGTLSGNRATAEGDRMTGDADSFGRVVAGVAVYGLKVR
jgi:hypothetical protein